MFSDLKNQYCQNDYTIQSNLQIKCNHYQIPSAITEWNLESLKVGNEHLGDQNILEFQKLKSLIRGIRIFCER